MWWLSAFFLVNGVWVAGQDMSPSGWSPRAYATKQECIERKIFAETACRAAPLKYRASWVCSEGAPIDAPPTAIDERDC
jgi:hypothetical protein